MELQIITEQTLFGKEFRVYGTVEEPLFLAKNVAELIDYNQKHEKPTPLGVG